MDSISCCKIFTSSAASVPVIWFSDAIRCCVATGASPSLAADHPRVIGIRDTEASGSVLLSFLCVCVCMLSSYYSGRRACGRTSRGHTGVRSHRVWSLELVSIPVRATAPIRGYRLNHRGELTRSSSFVVPHSIVLGKIPKYELLHDTCQTLFHAV